MTGMPDQTEQDTAPHRRVEPGLVAASALALGALSLPDPARLGPGRTHLLRLGRAAYLGWYARDLSRRVPLPDVPASLLAAAGGAAAALATAPVDEATDRWLDARLRRWGVRRPRLLLALAGAGMGAALALDSQTTTPTAEGLLQPDDLFETVEVPIAARALIVALLDVATSPPAGEAQPGLAGSATTLRAQLDRARASVLGGEPMTTDVFLVVPDDVRRVVPHAQTWPVRAHFEADGLPLLVELTVGDGRLAGLSIMPRSDDLPGDDDRWAVDLLDVLEAWPTPEQVRLVVETAEGHRPVS